MPAVAQSFEVQARVISSEPVYNNVPRAINQQVCKTENVPVYSQQSNRYNRYGQRNNNSIGKLIGGAVGGYVGNQFGAGQGNTIATIGGALVGGMLGGTVDRKREKSGIVAYQQVENCRAVTKQVVETVLVGYRTTFDYQGRIGSVNTPNQYHSGNFILLNLGQ